MTNLAAKALNPALVAMVAKAGVPLLGSRRLFTSVRSRARGRGRARGTVRARARARGKVRPNPSAHPDPNQVGFFVSALCLLPVARLKGCNPWVSTALFSLANAF